MGISRSAPSEPWAASVLQEKLSRARVGQHVFRRPLLTEHNYATKEAAHARARAGTLKTVQQPCASMYHPRVNRHVRMCGPGFLLPLRCVMCRTCGSQVGGKSFSRATRSGLVARLGVLNAASSKEVISKALDFGWVGEFHTLRVASSSACQCSLRYSLRLANSFRVLIWRRISLAASSADVGRAPSKIISKASTMRWLRLVSAEPCTRE